MGKQKYPYAEVAQKQVCEGVGQLEKVFQDILDTGGEGIILRDPSSPYEPGRSRGFLKHKVSLSSFTCTEFSFARFSSKPRNLGTLRHESSARCLHYNGSVSCAYSPPPPAFLFLIFHSSLKPQWYYFPRIAWNFRICKTMGTQARGCGQLQAQGILAEQQKAQIASHP